MWIDKEIGTKKSHFSIKKKCDYMAEKVGFEPTCPGRQPHFECGSL